MESGIKNKIPRCRYEKHLWGYDNICTICGISKCKPGDHVWNMGGECIKCTTPFALEPLEVHECTTLTNNKMSENEIFNHSRSKHNGIIIVVIMGAILLLCLITIGILQITG